ncbi:MAG: thioredoxin-dependent thiol peroxidase [Phycisphaerae bacterium]|mgnify:FL=1|nr:thioredoxin-dependent thiol peroxidase [Phycisphaerae bacterium]
MAKSTSKAKPYPAAGSKAPAFSAPASDGKTVKLADLKGKVVALYFYPKDDTPGCTKEACGFRDAFDKLRTAGIEVLGVSPDSTSSHRKFIDKFALPFRLLADEDHGICEAYGVWQKKSMYGKEYLGVARTTFVIDRDGTIAHVFEKVKPDGHEQEVLDWVRQNLN